MNATLSCKCNIQRILIPGDLNWIQHYADLATEQERQTTARAERCPYLVRLESRLFRALSRRQLRF